MEVGTSFSLFPLLPIFYHSFVSQFNSCVRGFRLSFWGFWNSQYPLCMDRGPHILG
jgi:hypothetical protein